MSEITSFKPGSISIQNPTSAECVINTVDTTADTITFTSTTTAIEVINDDASINIAVRFDGSAAAIPTNSANLQQSHLVRPREARFFGIAVTSMSIIAASGTPQFRVTAWL